MSTTDTAAHHITLTTPISREDIEDIRVGDVVFLDGHITTCRDVAHRRLIEYGRELPVNIRDGAILHAGPIIRMIDEEANRFEVVAVGPTTSMRMEMFEEEFIARTGVRLIVGKGGMGPGTEAGCRRHGALHCVFPAGNAVIAATAVEEVEDAQWRDLGMPETLWTFRVKQFGAAVRAPQQYRAFCRVRRGGARIDRERGAGRQNREDFRRSAAEAGRDAGVIERIDHAADSDHETIFYRARGRARR